MSETVERLLGTCPICEGTYKLHDERMVHHGFKRPGDGAIHGDCFAVGHPPYEVSCEITKVYRVAVQESLDRLNATLARYKTGEVTYFTEYRGRRGWTFAECMVEYALGVTEPYTWSRMYESKTHELEYQIRMTTSEIARLTRLIDTWQPRDIRTVMEDKAQNEKAARDARAAEVKAKRDERAKKEAEKKARREALAAKRLAVKKSFVDGFEALAKEPKTVERTAKVDKLTAKFRKVPTLWWHDLKCDEALLTLGVAYQENGRINYRGY